MGVSLKRFRKQMEKTLEYFVSKEVLQEREEIKIGGFTFNVAPPTVATMILVSRYISQLPNFDIESKSEDVLKQVLAIAPDCDCLGDIAAIMILGSKDIVQKKKVPQLRLFGRTILSKEIDFDYTRTLGRKIIDILDPKELNELLGKLFARTKPDFFFGTIIFLNEANLLRKTKSEGKTTASGQ
jgi:hypothetical protein